MKMPALILTVMAAATLLMASAVAQDRVKELQKERIATLKKIADVTAVLFQNGRAPFEEVLEARRLVFKAEVDTAEKESDRITIYKNIVDSLKEQEKWAEARAKSIPGKRGPIPVLQLKAWRLEATRFRGAGSINTYWPTT